MRKVKPNLELELSYLEQENTELKETIQRLYQKNDNQRSEVQKLKNELRLEKEDKKQILEKSQSDFLLYKNKLQNELTEKVQILNNEHDQEIQKLKVELEFKRLKPTISEEPVKNERNAGRKSIITDELIDKITRMRAEGIAQKSIAEALNVSVGTVNKLLRLTL